MIHCDISQPDKNTVEVICHASPEEFQPVRITCDINGVAQVVCTPAKLPPPPPRVGNKP